MRYMEIKDVIIPTSFNRVNKVLLLAVFLFSITHTASGQQKRINLKGVVTSKDGVPFIGCNISLKGTRYSTTTQVCGNFEISIPEDYNGILSFSCFNARSYEVELFKLKDKEKIIVL